MMNLFLSRLNMIIDTLLFNANRNNTAIFIHTIFAARCLSKKFLNSMNGMK